MTESFDAYHRWLGISPKHQPPNHYRLLSLELFEDDAEVIRDASERQMSHIRGYSLGKHADISHQILNDLARARACLLDNVKKADYDTELRRQSNPPPKPPPKPAVPSVQAPTIQVDRPAPRSAPTSPMPSSHKSLWSMPKKVVVGVGVLLSLILFGGVLWTLNRETPPDGPGGGIETVVEELGEEYTNSLGMKFRLIPAGEFMMGSPKDEKYREDFEQQHRVRITRPFYLGVHEVTQEQWESLMGTAPWKNMKHVQEGSDYAASFVSWEEAQEFAKKLSSKEGVTYRLPTEAEWEYACRAGTSTAYSFGASYARLGTYAWYGGLFGEGNCQDEMYAHRVGQKRPNARGLYDMHGNVWEWCQDWYDEDYYGESPPDDPLGPSSGIFRVNRGGSWIHYAWSCRSASRGRFSPDFPRSYLGFRLVRVPSE